MTDITQTILTEFPVRKTTKQKEAFRLWLCHQLKQMGYKPALESRGSSTNVVCGDVQRARYLVSAHYDTCASLGLPDPVTPCDPLLYLLYQGTVALGLLAVSFLAALAVSFPLGMPGLFLPLLLLFYLGSFWLLLAGPANRQNANNNTSGVATLLAVMDRLPREARKRVCFVFFDDREKGMLGSAAFRRQHGLELRQDLVHICLDCVGDGDYLVLVPSKQCRWDGELLDALRENVTAGEGKTVDIRLGGYFLYPSDCRRSKRHILVSAFHRKPFVGYYTLRTRTRWDTVLDRENVRLLSQGLVRFLAASV